MIADPCVFCEIIAERAPAEIVEVMPTSLIFRPLGPVTPGHVLVVPLVHVEDASEDAHVTALTMHDAAEYAACATSAFNIITSAGRAATQSIFHLHVHVVPRSEDDGLMVPWGTLFGENPQDPHRCRRVVELEREVETMRMFPGSLANPS